MKPLFFSSILLGTALAVYACGGDDDGGSTPAPAPATDAGTATKTDAGGTRDGSTTTQTVNGCTSYTDLTTQTSATITFPTGASPAQYSTPCIKVKAGTAITFTGSFESHPLAPSGGDSPSPIAAKNSGSTATFTPSAAGTFGFHCGFHPTVMLGAIQVVN